MRKNDFTKDPNASVGERILDVITLVAAVLLLPLLFGLEWWFS